MPIPGPAALAWRSPDGRATLLHWGSRPDGPGTGEAAAATARARAALHEEATSQPRATSHPGTMTSHAGTIWTGPAHPGSGRAPVYARTSITRVDPVYLAEAADAVIISDRATWAGWTANRLDAHDPLHVAALLNPGFPLGSATPFDGVSALSSATTLHLLNGTVTRLPTPNGARPPAPPRSLADGVTSGLSETGHAPGSVRGVAGRAGGAGAVARGARRGRV